MKYTNCNIPHTNSFVLWAEAYKRLTTDVLLWMLVGKFIIPIPYSFIIVGTDKKILEVQYKHIRTPDNVCLRYLRLGSQDQFQDSAYGSPWGGHLNH